MKETFQPLFEGELAIFEGGNLPASKFDDDIFKQTASAGDYLPRLQLMTSASEKCKSGDFPMNHFALIRDSAHDDLGSQVDVAVLAWRPKAMDMSDDIIVVFDPKPDDDGNPTGEFARIAEASKQSDSNCMWGHEYLVYIPESKSMATVFFGTKTSRRESPNMKARMHKAATLKPQKIQTKSYVYYSMQVQACQQNLDLPDKDSCLKAIDSFLNEKGTDLAPKTETESTERAR